MHKRLLTVQSMKWPVFLHITNIKLGHEIPSLSLLITSVITVILVQEEEEPEKSMANLLNLIWR